MDELQLFSLPPNPALCEAGGGMQVQLLILWQILSAPELGLGHALFPRYSTARGSRINFKTFFPETQAYNYKRTGVVAHTVLGCELA